MLRLLIATRNLHKVGEIRSILGKDFQYLTLSDIPTAPEVVEDAGTFAGNATKKAVELAAFVKTRLGGALPSVTASRQQPFPTTDLFVMADDSGLEVDALSGAPGVHSARFAALDTGAKANSATGENNAKLLRLLNDVPLEKRTARFHCVIALARISEIQSAEASSPVCYANEAELHTELFDGVCEGRIGFELRGTEGFGYDPLFFPNGYAQTFGELSEEVKNRLSHRAKALEKMKRWLERSRV